MRGSDETSAEPMRTICAHADEWRDKPGLVDLSIFNVHPFIDGPRAGQAVLVYDDGHGVGEAASKALAEALWEARNRFTETLPSVAEILEAARNASVPSVLGDQGDRVLGAGPGVSVEIARLALEQFPGLPVATAVFDPPAVAAAQAAGVGVELELAIGASINKTLQPFLATWRVTRLGRARFVNEGPYMAGAEADFGDYAVFVAGALSVVVTTLVPNVHDPAFYEAVGLPVASQKAVVARSANHYKLSFAKSATPVTVDTAGPDRVPAAGSAVQRDSASPSARSLDPVTWKFSDGFTRL